MKKYIILLLTIILFLFSCSEKIEEKQESQNKEKIEKVFEHYFSYNMYSNNTMPILIHEELIDLVAKENKITSDELQKLYEEYYLDWYNQRVEKYKIYGR